MYTGKEVNFFDMCHIDSVLPRQKYVHVYIEEKVGTLADTNEDEIAWIDEDETVRFDDVDIVYSTIRNTKTVRNDETVRIDGTDNIDETVRNDEMLGLM
ncbi:hypothetical protein V6N13_059857 [Hibiscus sabdariffa]